MVYWVNVSERFGATSTGLSRIKGHQMIDVLMQLTTNSKCK